MLPWISSLFHAIRNDKFKPNALFEPRHDKTNKVTMRPAKTQISLGIRPVWSESSLCAQWIAKDPSFLHADSEDSDQTGWMHSHFVGFVMTRLISFTNLQVYHNHQTANSSLLLGAVARSEARPLGMQASPSSIPTFGTFFRGDLAMKTFLRPFSLFRWFK